MIQSTLLATSALVFLLPASAPAQGTTLVKQIRPQKPHNHFVLPGAPLVGGSDSCTTPDAITGTGTFSLDTTTATTGTQGQGEPLCNQFGTSGIDLDVWFVWTASFTGQADITTCNQNGGNDTKISVYNGTGCPAPGSSLVCNDDFCGLESLVSLNVTTGNNYVIQIGEYPFGAGLLGTFSITQNVPPVVPPNDGCATPTVIAGAGPHPYDNRAATTGAQGQGQAVCNFFGATGISNDQWYTWTASMAGTATLTTCNGLSPSSPGDDTKVAIYDGAGCPVGPAVACNDDDGACGITGLLSTVMWTTVCGQTYTIQLGRYPGSGGSFGTFDIAEGTSSCGPPGTPYCFGDGTLTPCPCGNNGAAGNGCANSINASGANLSASGQPQIGNDTLVLQGTGMPNASCLYFQGTSQISVAFGDGLRCAGGTIRRLGTKVNAGGASQYPGAGDQSVSVKGAVTLPGTRAYQVWYRNAAAFCTPSTFNLSNGLSITWQ